MARFRKRKDVNLGSISIGGGDAPVRVDETDSSVQERRKEIEEDVRKKVEEYRKENPEEPKTESEDRALEAPLKLKRKIGSLDSEYVGLAKRYLGLPSNSKPTVVDLSKSIIKLFEDNMKLYKELTSLRQRAKNSIDTSIKNSWEQNNSWN